MSTYELRTVDGMSFPLQKSWVKIGRGPDNDIVIQDESISRHHLNLYIQPDGIVIEDAGSQNGYGLNGAIKKTPSRARHGDTILLGRSRYWVAMVGVPLPHTHNKVDRVADISSVGGAPPSKVNRQTASSRGLVLGLGLVILLGAAYLFQNPQALKQFSSRQPGNSSDQTTQSNPAGSAEHKDSTQSLPSQSYLPPAKEARSQQEVQADARFREALRDYQNAIYSRALLYFQEALALNPSHHEASLYLTFTKQKISERIKEDLELGRKEFANLRYARCKMYMNRVLTLMSDEIPGFVKKLSIDRVLASGELTPAETPQDTILLQLPCASTSRATQCEEAKKMLRLSIQQLGEEEVIK